MDNVAITPGAGATIATDDVGGVQFQRIKIDAGAEGASSPVSAQNPLPVAVTFPGTQPVSGTVALDGQTLAALETISVANFPATQPVSAASLPPRPQLYAVLHCMYPRGMGVMGTCRKLECQRSNVYALLDVADRSLAAWFAERDRQRLELRDAIKKSFTT